MNEQLAQEIVDALYEAAEAYNRAVAIGSPTATVSPRELYLLIAGAAQGYGVIELLHQLDINEDSDLVKRREK